jgi:hypothetical protein
MSRYVSWLAISVAAAFLVVASTAFSLSAVQWVAFGVSVGTLGVSTVLAYYDRHHVVPFVTSALIAVVSAWTIVASLVFTHSTVQHLTLASSLAISGLAIVGLTSHELSHNRAARLMGESGSEQKTRLAAAG